MVAEALRPPRAIVRSDTATWALQGALDRKGLGPVAGVDEAGRGACAGPLVVAAAVLRQSAAAKLAGLTDSKLLTKAARDRMFDLVRRYALDYAVVVIAPEEVDAGGVHAANIEGMRRAIARLDGHPGYVLTDGFVVPGLTAPSMGVVAGDKAAACVAAASVLAKVTRDRIMTDLHGLLPQFGFDGHKGYCTSVHTAALREHGPSVEHRWSFANVAAAGVAHGMTAPRRVVRSVTATARLAGDDPAQYGLDFDLGAPDGGAAGGVPGPVVVQNESSSRGCARNHPVVSRSDA